MLVANVQKIKDLFEKGFNKTAKMQNISQNKFNQIMVMCDLSRDRSEQIAKNKKN